MKEKSSANPLSNFISAAGVILAVSYPVLAISTGVRAIFQLFKGDLANSPWLTLIGAICYAIAMIGFIKQPRPDLPISPAKNRLARAWQQITPAQAWRISALTLTVELVCVLVVGTISWVEPDWLGRNVWQFFGRDYGYLPLIQPILGMLWLFQPTTRHAYQSRVDN